ncbi:YhgE/Pip domain-containing protein [Propionicicella superfundia]|uniref:YhgE/Pip domain-containing protein n=1 Tax=Propionicicella superfundia TaxID=348582 RepID=UPI0003FEEB62|nr:YhgE/Pip domain-containing protein [Propionicicella superfundia]
MSKRHTWYTLVGVLLVPLIFAAGFLAATWNLDSRLHTVQAAIVNNDEAVTVNGQTVPLGRQLTAALVDSDREQNLDWVIASAEDASAGLGDGTYAAVVTIPENFSAAATSYAKDADSAHKATIKIQTSSNGGIAETSLGQSVAKEAVTTLNASLTTTYLDQIYVGFNDMHTQFTDLKTGTQQLADGASSLSTGIGQASTGTDQLATGLEQLSAGSAQLNSGASQLDSGASQLATGASQLATGASQLNSQTAQLPSQTKALADGVSTYVAGVDTLIDETETQTTASAAQLAKLGQVSVLTGGMTKLNTGLQTYKSGMEALVDDPSPVAAEVTTQVQSQIGGACPAEIQAAYGDAGCAGFAAGLSTGVSAGVSGGASAAVTGLTTEEDGSTIMSGAANLSAGATEFQQTVDAIDVPTQSELDAATKKLEQLRAGGSELASGTKKLADGMPALSSGISQLSSGATQLSTGATQLSSGVSQFTTGLTQYTAGVDQTATGARTLATGLSQAAEGASELSTGTQKLATGVAEGATQVPTYSATERKNLSEVVAAPVSDDSVLGLPGPGVAWASLVVVVALWLGAMAMYIVTTTIRKGAAMSTASSARVLGESLLPGAVVGAVQAVVLAVVAAAIGVPQGLALTGVLLLASLAFIAINFALVALFKNVGRWLSAGFVILTTATALTSALPSWLSVLKPLSPVGSALEAVRALMNGQSLVNPLIALTGWLLLGLVGCVVAVLRSRKVPASELVAVH